MANNMHNVPNEVTESVVCFPALTYTHTLTNDGAFRASEKERYALMTTTRDRDGVLFVEKH